MAKIQFVVDFSEESLKKMERMIEDCGFSTRKDSRRDLINEALSLFEWVIKMRKNGYMIGAMDPDKTTFKEIVMDTFPVIAKIRLHPFVPPKPEG